MAELAKARFGIGEVVRHRMFGYRGLVFDVDPVYSNDPEWYEAMAHSRPPKDRPWYHVLVDGAEHITYVAERNLEKSDDSSDSIDHPLLPELFFEGRGGGYCPRTPIN